MQERRNQGVLLNVQKIFAEKRIDDKRVQIVTRSGTATGDDRRDIATTREPWVKKAEPKHPIFDPLWEKEFFQEEIKEFMGTKSLTSRSTQVNAPVIYDRPPRLDPGKNSEANVCNMRNFLQSCMKIIRYQRALEELKSIFNSCD